MYIVHRNFLEEQAKSVDISAQFNYLFYIQTVDVLQVLLELLEICRCRCITGIVDCREFRVL